ncbi:hypothetical protein ACH5RR_023816 [Cinchona calisaya]|uniref:Uncharacterized protein n=1 Tax=Cinchona calisaya TaxID=153742 RepID=A0ABD2ZBR2_9GENT
MAPSIPKISLLLTFVALSSLVMTVKSLNFSQSLAFAPAVATFFGDPNGAGSNGGACGFEDAVGKPPYSSRVSAGNQALFKQGKGCGTCYSVLCTTASNSACSGSAVRVVITDQCPGSCDNDPVHFDLSGTAFGALAKPGLANQLRNAGRINILFQRVPCNYGNQKILFHVDRGSNPFFFAFVIEFENGDGDLASVEIQQAGSNQFLRTQQNFGASYKINSGQPLKGPFSIRLTQIESRRSIVAQNVIPANWKPGDFFLSRVNF